MQKIKQFLERWPLLYRILRKIYLPLALRYIAFRGYLNRNRLGKLWAKRGNGWVGGIGIRATILLAETKSMGPSKRWFELPVRD